MADRQFLFAPFRLDPSAQQLWRGEELVPLRPKLFAVLRRLVEDAGRLVTRDELRAAVWSGAVISESVLRGTIRELRDALGDDAIAARFVETIPHRGYRFVAPVSVIRPVAAEATPTARPERRARAARGDVLLIGRDAELARLHDALDRAAAGARQVVFVTGEPGIGKTSIVDAFLGAAAEVDAVRTARGQCVEHYGTGEAYLPVLEALGQLCRQAGGEQMIALLSRYAPTWLAQMPGLISDAELDTVQRRVQGATRERMVRELAEALEAASAAATVVLVLEDLHWSDYSTLDLISALAQRRTPARLLLLGTYRPADVIVSGHPLKALKQELQIHQQCDEVPLHFLDQGEVRDYLDARFPRQQLPAELGQALHRSTEGNPLFVVNVIDYWLGQRVLVETAGRWQLTAPIADVSAGVPDSLREMIEKQLDRFTPEECRVVEAASVAGMEFSTAAVAAALEEETERIEEVCEALSERKQLLRERGTDVLADGSVTGRYRFRHALYQQVLYERVAVARRVRLHRRVGEWQEVAYGRRAAEAAAELAMHFERAHEPERAVRYLTDAGTTALRRSAHPEAITLLTRGVNVLLTLPETPARIQQELTLQATLGAALAVTKGYAAPEVERAQQRAVDLCERVGEASQLFPVLAGLWGFRFLRAELPQAAELSAQLSRLAESGHDSGLLVWAHTLRGLTAATRGDFAPAHAHLDAAIGLYDPQLHGPDRTQVGAQDPKVTCLSYAAWTLWHLGYPDQARQRIDEALSHARDLGHPFSFAFALDFAGAGVGMFLRDLASVEAHAGRLVNLCYENGFPHWLGWGSIRQGWVLTERSEVAAGIAMMRDGMAILQKTGAQLSMAYILGQLAAAHGNLGRPAEGLALLTDALALVESTEERWYESELHRLKGELLLQADTARQSKRSTSSTRKAIPESVEASFRTALQVARRQQAKSFELRAATSLSRLWQRQGKRRQAHELLSDICGWFREGFDTADRRDADALLEQLR